MDWSSSSSDGPPSEESTKATLASHRPIEKRPMVLPKRAQPNSTELIFSTKPEEPRKLLLYYCIGDLLMRPVGFFNGIIMNEYSRIVPYVLRRSNGQIAYVPYDPSDYNMVHDMKAIMEVNVAPAHTCGVIIKATQTAKIFVYGEIARGFCFGAPSKLELSGCLYLARWTVDGLAEEPINRNCIIELVAGIANVFLCDYKELVVMFDQSAKFTLTMQEEEGVFRPSTAPVVITSPEEQSSTQKPGKTFSPPEQHPSLSSFVQELPVNVMMRRTKSRSGSKKSGQASNSQSLLLVAGGGSKSKSHRAPSITNQDRETFAAIVKRMNDSQDKSESQRQQQQLRRKLKSSKSVIQLAAPAEPKVSQPVETAQPAEQLFVQPEPPKQPEPAKLPEPAKHEPARLPEPAKHEPAKLPEPEKHEPARLPEPEKHEPAKLPEPAKPPEPEKPPETKPKTKTKSLLVVVVPPQKSKSPAKPKSNVSGKGVKGKNRKGSKSPAPSVVTAKSKDKPKSKGKDKSNDKDKAKPTSKSQVKTSVGSDKPIKIKTAKPSSLTGKPKKLTPSAADALDASSKSTLSKSDISQTASKRPSSAGDKPKSKEAPMRIKSSSRAKGKLKSADKSKTPTGKSDQKSKNKSKRNKSKTPSSAVESKASSSSDAKTKVGSKVSSPNTSSVKSKTDDKKKSKKKNKSKTPSSVVGSKASTPEAKSQADSSSPTTLPVESKDKPVSPSVQSVPKSAEQQPPTNDAKVIPAKVDAKLSENAKKNSLESIQTDAKKKETLPTVELASDKLTSDADKKKDKKGSSKKKKPQTTGSKTAKVKSSKSAGVKSKRKSKEGAADVKASKPKSKGGVDADTKGNPKKIPLKKVKKPKIKIKTGKGEDDNLSVPDRKDTQEASKKKGEQKSSTSSVSSSESPATSPPSRPKLLAPSPTKKRDTKSSPGKVLDSIKKAKSRRVKSGGVVKAKSSDDNQKKSKPEPSITPTTSPTSFEKGSEGTPNADRLKKNNDLIQTIQMIRQRPIKTPSTDKNAKDQQSEPVPAAVTEEDKVKSAAADVSKSTQPAESPSQASAASSQPSSAAESQKDDKKAKRRPSQTTVAQKLKVKEEMDDLMRVLGDTGNRITKIKSSHSQESKQPGQEELSAEEKQEMVNEVEAFKKKMSHVIEGLKKLVQNITETLREELMEDVTILQDCADAMTPGQFDEYSERILAITKKIDRLLNNFKKD